MAKEASKKSAKAEAKRRVGDAIESLSQIKQDGFYRTLPASLCLLIDRELRHLDRVQGRIDAWAVTKSEKRQRAEARREDEAA
tara:strand:- start:592 stop:840 length:249 start_codon:yes stop_codon:yes gene_type:complete